MPTSVAVAVPPNDWLQPSGINLPDNLDFERWSEVGRFLRLADGAVQWWIGDWINYGEQHYGEKYAQALESTGLERHTLENMASVCSRFESSRRRDLPFGHHAEVAYLDPSHADALLDKAVEHRMSRSGLRDAVRVYKTALNGTGHSNGNGAPPPRPEPAKPPAGGRLSDVVEPDPLAEWERSEKENQRLREVVETLQVDDTTRELAKVSDRYARLEGRLQQAMTSGKEAEKEATYAKGMLRKIRAALGVEADKDILPAIADLKR